jgi:hypothetical protein
MPTDDVSISATHLRALITRVNRTKAETVELSADGALVARVQSSALDASFTAIVTATNGCDLRYVVTTAWKPKFVAVAE